MSARIPLRLCRAAGGLLALAAAMAAPGVANAGAAASCDRPFIFQGSPANVVPITYRATTVNETDADADFRRRLYATARRLTWLFKLQNWHRPTYGGLGAVAHFERINQCAPDEMLRELVLDDRIRQGQAVVVLEGRIYIEGEQIFVQSRLRGLRRNDAHFDRYEDPLSRYFAGERLTAEIGAGGARRTLAAELPPLDITFAPRALTFADLDRIDSAFQEANRVYARPDLASSSRVLDFAEGLERAFSVQIVEGGWIRADDGRGDVAGFIKVNPESVRFLTEKLPELDALHGILGYLRLQQARAGGHDYGPPPRSTPRIAMESLETFVVGTREANDPTAAAFAHALYGAIAGGDLGDWTTARRRFIQAAKLKPYVGAWRGLLGVANAALCCGDRPEPGHGDPAANFARSLSLEPGDLSALRNLDSFLGVLNVMNAEGRAPRGVNVENLAQRRQAVERAARQQR